MPIQNCFVFKVLKLFYLKSGNNGTENMFYNTRSADKLLLDMPKVNKELKKTLFSIFRSFYF